jgi:hypothetical protein
MPSDFDAEHQLCKSCVGKIAGAYRLNQTEVGLWLAIEGIENHCMTKLADLVNADDLNLMARGAEQRLQSMMSMVREEWSKQNAQHHGRASASVHMEKWAHMARMYTKAFRIHAKITDEQWVLGRGIQAIPEKPVKAKAELVPA